MLQYGWVSTAPGCGRSGGVSTIAENGWVSTPMGGGRVVRAYAQGPCREGDSDVEQQRGSERGPVDREPPRWAHRCHPGAHVRIKKHGAECRLHVWTVGTRHHVRPPRPSHPGARAEGGHVASCPRCTPVHHGGAGGGSVIHVDQGREHTAPCDHRQVRCRSVRDTVHAPAQLTPISSPAQYSGPNRPLYRAVAYLNCMDR